MQLLNWLRAKKQFNSGIVEGLNDPQVLARRLEVDCQEILRISNSRQFVNGFILEIYRFS